MNDADDMSQAQKAIHTFAYLRRIESKLGAITSQVQSVSEILLRHEARLGRIERDVGEVKSDLILLENQILSRMTEIFHVTRHLEAHSERLEKLESGSPRPQA